MFLLGFIFSSIVGTLGHFLYNWTNIKIFKYIYAHDESLWAHLKLGITPMIIWTFIEKIFLHDKYLYSINALGIIIFIIIISFVYLFGILIKKEIALLNIISFYISLAISYLITFLLFNMINIPSFLFIIGNILFVIYFLLYFILSRFY